MIGAKRKKFCNARNFSSFTQKEIFLFSTGNKMVINVVVPSSPVALSGYYLNKSFRLVCHDYSFLGRSFFAGSYHAPYMDIK